MFPMQRLYNMHRGIHNVQPGGRGGLLDDAMLLPQPLSPPLFISRIQ